MGAALAKKKDKMKRSHEEVCVLVFEKEDCFRFARCIAFYFTSRERAFGCRMAGMYRETHGAAAGAETRAKKFFLFVRA